MAEGSPSSSRVFRLAIAAALLFTAIAVGQDWYWLGPYKPSGWQASDYIKVAVVCAGVNVVLGLGMLLGYWKGPQTIRFVRVLATVALAAVILRMALPPHFGFDFAGVEIDTRRLVGAWLGFGAAAVSALCAWLTGPD